MGEFSPYLTGILSVLLFTSFIKILTGLSILRVGLGLKGSGFGAVVILASFILSLLVLNSELESTVGIRVDPMHLEALAKVDLPKILTPYMERHSDLEVQKKLNEITQGKKEGSPSGSLVLATFLVSQLREAIRVGVMILVPFLVIDLLVVNVLMVLGITQMSQAVLALPLKLLLFLSVDGWSLVIGKLIGG